MENTNYEQYSFSPLEVFHWIKNGALAYIKAENALQQADYKDFEIHFEKQFSDNFPKVKHLIFNELDEGNISFTVLVVSLYEAFLAVGFSEKNAMIWTEKSINEPIYAFMVEGTEKMLDEAENPFKALVQVAKTREKAYFGTSFHFQRPIDDDFGYVLHINKCVFHEILKFLGKTELQPLVCRIDLGWINGIKPEKHGVRFIRPTTFASGNSCQMWFVKEEKL
ncbi:MAG: L-2-amino-thiazoline-4-carboxylic acid hydrolase [Capnocytophaga sp.]|nr:L-2-amino-thiazoline-4-carboxylic acid hydrolase [Capnocytophaga sp.]